MAAAELMKGVETISGLQFLAGLQYSVSPFGPCSCFENASIAF
jgi:hypothetical protein